MSTVDNQKYFVRIRGKIMGPFTLDQLTSLKNRGRLHDEHEVSTDRSTWVPANRIEGLFERKAAEAVATNHREVKEESTDSEGSTSWYYTIDDVQKGPVSFAKLEKLCRNGRISDDDLVWNENLDEWIAVSEVDGLETSANAKVKKQSKGKSPTFRSDSHGQTIFWDALLDGVRSTITAEGLEATFHGMIKRGSLAMTIAIISWFGVVVTQGVKSDSIQVILWGMCSVLVLSALKYVAVHLSFASEELVRNTPNTLATPAFPNAISVLLLSTGVGIAGISVYYALESNDLVMKILLLLVAGESLVVFIGSAYATLRPDWLNIKIESGANAALEGVAVFSMSLKLFMRLLTVVFCVSAWIGAVVLITSNICFIIGGEWLLTAIALSSVGVTQLSAASIAPLIGYLCFVLGSILPGTAQAILLLSRNSES